MASEELFKELEDIYFPTFKEAVIDTFNKLVKTLATVSDVKRKDEGCSTSGVTVIMGIIGKYGGRMIFDTSFETASAISSKMLKRDPKSKEEVLAIMSEFANIVSGNACSMVNRKNKVFGLRVAPPTILFGESINIFKG